MWHHCDIVLCRLEFRLRRLSGRAAETSGGPSLTPEAGPGRLTTVNASSVVGTSRNSQTSNRRSMLLNASLFGDFRLSTLICWRSIRISASSRPLDRNSPVSAHPSSKRRSIIGHEHHPIRPFAPPVWGFRQDRPIQ